MDERKVRVKKHNPTGYWVVLGRYDQLNGYVFSTWEDAMKVARRSVQFGAWYLPNRYQRWRLERW